MSYSNIITNIIPKLPIPTRQSLVYLMPDLNTTLKNELMNTTNLTENVQQELFTYLSSLPQSKENIILNTIADFPLSSLVQNFTSVPVSYKADILNILPLPNVVKQQMLTSPELSENTKLQFINAVLILEENVRNKIKEITTRFLDLSFLLKSNFITFLKNFLEVLQTHFNMFSLDIKKLGRNSIIIVIASFVAILTSIFTLLLISMYIISIFWENHRNAAFISVIFVYLAITIAGIVVIIKTCKDMTYVFENTINEFDNTKKKFT